MPKEKLAPHFLVSLILIGIIFQSPASLMAAPPKEATSPKNFIYYQAPEFLNFKELEGLSQNPYPPLRTRQKMQKFFSTPIISNEAYYEGVKASPRYDYRLGSFLRIATWNIEKSMNADRAITTFTSEERFKLFIDPEKAPKGSLAYQRMLLQRQKLAMADILILQEMDIGVKRSAYRDAPRDLAKALKMNYAYGAEQLEVDPVMLGIENVYFKGGGVDEAAVEYYKVDPKKYKGVFGSAVLSRYPIKHAEVFQLKTQPYDWYFGEKDKPSFLEETRRFSTKTAFENEITREIKIGGRIFFRVDLEIPGLPGNTLTIINIHLEIKCPPKGRGAQIAEILHEYIKNIKNPVIMAGDFNSTAQDLSATSFGRVAEQYAENPVNWLATATSWLVPYGWVVNPARIVSNSTKNLQDPTAKNIPYIAPNSQREMFDMIKNFRFDDGGAFDFRGDENRSFNGKKGTLANSNERDFKGFKTSFRVKRPIGLVLGKERLDWIFVKSFSKDSTDESQPYKFAPHYGETLEAMNVNLFVPISDHHPNIVDLPFKEPKITDQR